MKLNDIYKKITALDEAINEAASASINMSGDNAEDVIKLMNALKGTEGAKAGEPIPTAIKPAMNPMMGPADPHDDMLSMMDLVSDKPKGMSMDKPGMDMDKPMDDMKPCGSEEDTAEGEWDNSPDEKYQDHTFMTKDIAKGHDGAEKKSYPKVAGGDNPMALEDELRAELSAKLSEFMNEKDCADCNEDPCECDTVAESDIDQIADVGKVYSKINKMKMDLVDDGMEPEDAQDKACEKYDCDPSMYDKYVEMKRDEREGTKKESKELDEGAVKDMMQDVEEGMDKKEFEKKYPGQDYDGIKKDIEDRMDEEKVEETTSGSVATSEGAGKPLYQNASVYESNEIVKRAMQLNEDMSVTVSAGTDAEPNININASGEDAAKMAELCKLAGIGMMGMGSQPQSPYGEVEIQVAEDQEFANGADDQNTMDTEYMTQDIAGGLNGPKKMAYPKVAGGDNPMAVLGESELNEVGEERLMKLYQEYKAN